MFTHSKGEDQQGSLSLRFHTSMNLVIVMFQFAFQMTVR